MPVAEPIVVNAALVGMGRRGHAPSGVVFGVAGVGITVVASVSQAATGIPSEPMLLNAVIGFALAGLGWLGVAIIKTRDAVLVLADPENGVVVQVKKLREEHEHLRDQFHEFRGAAEG